MMRWRKEQVKANIYKIGLCIFLIIVAINTIIAVPVVPSEPVKKEYVMGLWTGKATGIANIIAEFQFKILNKLSKKLGIKFTLKFFDSPIKVGEEINKGRVDISGFTPLDYVRARETRVKITPIATYVVGGFEKETQTCIFVKKDSKIKSISDLKGKPFAGTFSSDGWIFLRKRLLRSGINAPPDKYFSLAKISEQVSAAYALITDNLSGFVTSQDMFQLFVKPLVGTLSREIIPIDCEINKTINSPIVVREGMNEEIENKLQELILTSHKDPDFKEYRGVFKQYKLTFIPVTDEYYKSIYEIYEEAKTRGWLSEWDEWVGRKE